MWQWSPRKQPKSLTLVILAVALALVLASCKSGGSEEAAAPSKPNPTTGANQQGSPPKRNLAYIANVMDPTVSVLDLDKLTISDNIVFPDLAGKQQGHFLSVSPDGKYVWIAEDISASGGYVQVLDLATRGVVKKWDVGAGVANYLTRDGKYLFTSSTKTNNINVFDVPNQQFLGDFRLGAAPHVIDTSPDGRVLWTTDGAGNLRSFDMSGLPEKLPRPLDSIYIGGNLHAVLAHPNGKYVFVGSADSGDNIVDVATKSIVAKVPGKPHNYEISPDRKYLLSGENEFATCDELKDLGTALGNSTGPLLRLVNIAALDSAKPDLSAIKTEKWLDAAGLGPASISHQVYSPNGKQILVTTYLHKDVSAKGEGKLLIVDSSSLKVQSVLDLPTRPHAIAYPGHNR